jgi:hypothetical protein
MQALECAAGSIETALRSARLALQVAVAPVDGAVTPATETQIQNAIDLLRKLATGDARLLRLEQIAAELRIIAGARRSGRPNLYASRLARLRRTIFRTDPTWYHADAQG